MNPGPGRPRIICLCGPGRFAPERNAAWIALAAAGHTVVDSPDLHSNQRMDAPDAVIAAHLRLIELADEVMIVTDDTGYIGEGTAKQIAHACKHGKNLKFNPGVTLCDFANRVGAEAEGCGRSWPGWLDGLSRGEKITRILRGIAACYGDDHHAQPATQHCTADVAEMLLTQLLDEDPAGTRLAQALEALGHLAAPVWYGDRFTDGTQPVSKQKYAAAVLASLGHAPSGHVYLSTSCGDAGRLGRPELHGYCQSGHGEAAGGETWVKSAACCKWCEAPCICWCHRSEPDAGAQAGEAERGLAAARADAAEQRQRFAAAARRIADLKAAGEITSLAADDLTRVLAGTAPPPEASHA